MSGSPSGTSAARVKRAPKIAIAIAVLALTVIALFWWWRSGQSGESGVWEAAPPSVSVETVKGELLTLSTELPGRIESTRVAEVRARVPGIVLRRRFEEGANVKAGQILFEIDPAPFKAALARAEATLYEARATVRRYESLVDIEAVSRQEYDAAVAASKVAEANATAARLDLGYATVTAPISGRIGRSLVTEGALVGQGEATPMALIQQINPVYVDFRQPVADVLRLRQALAEGRLQQREEERARISLFVEGTGEQREGYVLFSDISVDRGTGQLLLRGEVPNADGLLLPGMYVRVRAGQGTDPSAIVVPQRSIRRGIDGTAQVLVVGADNVVKARPVQTGAMHGNRWHVVSGLQSGERIVVDGNANDGDKVAISPPKGTPTQTGQEAGASTSDQAGDQPR